MRIDAESYRQHAREQGGTPQSVTDLLRGDLLHGVLQADIMRLTAAILAGHDAVLTLDVRDSYADLPELEASADDRAGVL